jgi:hypothetical protein
MLDINMAGIEIDKKTESFTVKIPEILKVRIDKLSAPEKSKLNQSILFLMAKHIHENQFNPADYLSSRDL